MRSFDMATPAGRLEAATHLTPADYVALLERHRVQTTICTVNGRDIRIINSQRFGTLYTVAGTDKAFQALSDARAFANSLERPANQ
jgi:hypothetical protein